MKSFTRIASVLILGLVMVTNASAFYADGSVMRDNSGSEVGSFLGYMGNVNDGLPPSLGIIPNWIGTYVIESPRGSANYVDNSGNAEFGLDGNVDVHWYQFSSNQAGNLSAFFEWGSDLSAFTVDFFQGTSESSHVGKNYDASLSDGHLYEDPFTVFPQGSSWWMRVVGRGAAKVGDDPVNNGYKVLLYPTAIPLPPAILLFGSAIAGFGVMGRKKKQRQAS